MASGVTASLSALEQELSNLLGVGIREVEPIRGGGNNRIFRVRVSDQRQYAVKVYWRDAHDGRDRLGTEFDSLVFMWSKDVRCIPEPVLSNRARGFAVYEYVDGEKIDGSRIDNGDIEQVVRFLSSLKELSRSEEARRLPPASEACFSVAEVVAGIAGRLARLRAVPHRDLRTFIEEDSGPFFEAATQAAERMLVQRGLSLDKALPFEQRVLSPSDYGFHNVLRRDDGRLVFVDFEYFGWDDPSKMVADFILHPAMQLSIEQKRLFLSRMSDVLGPSFRDRLRIVYPLHGVAWCARLLNEFVPEHARRREFAFQGAEHDRPRLEDQLRRAKHKLEQIRQDYREIIA